MDSWETQPGAAARADRPAAAHGGRASPALRREVRDVEAAEALQEALAVLGDNEEAVQTLHMAIASARRFAALARAGQDRARSS